MRGRRQRNNGGGYKVEVWSCKTWRWQEEQKYCIYVHVVAVKRGVGLAVATGAVKEG